MLESLTSEMFAARIGDRFRLRLEADRTIELELFDATVLGARPLSGRRAPFSILFRGPLSPVLPQRIYRLEHDAMEALDLFLVPLGAREGGMVYEAIFT
jgi:hypothetical protein